VKLFRKRQPDAPKPGPREPRPWLTPETVPPVEKLRKVSLTTFLWARIHELEDIDPDGAEQCRQMMNDCCDRINLNHRTGNPPNYVRGDVKDWGPVLKLVQNWADHPDFRPEWKTP
jgi:hypothetical protein